MNLPVSLQEAVKHFTRAARASSTMKAYHSDARIFAAWCNERGLQSFPAVPSTVAAFVADQAGRDTCSVATIGRRLAAIARVHKVKGWPNPIDDTVRDVMSGARRQAGHAGNPSTPLVIEDIKQIVATIETHSLIGVRDRALILVGFAGALRRSELRGLMVGNLEEVSAGYLLTVAKSKTDQYATGQVIALARGVSASLCPCSAVKVWLMRAEISAGAVFRSVDERRSPAVGTEALSDHAIGLIIKRRARLAGIDARHISAHSLRSGALTSGALAGANMHKLAELSRHKSYNSIKQYVRPVDIFKDHALSKVL